MPYTPVTFQTFHGLNVHDDPEEVGGEGATDLLNVDLDRLGRVRTRDGAAQYDTSGGGGRSAYRSFADYTQATPRLLLADAGTTVNLDYISGSGTTIANMGSWAVGAGTGLISAYATIGTPTSTLMYIATTGTVATTLRKLNNTTLSAATGSPVYVAVTPWDNRLVQAFFGSAANSPTGANGSKSTVFFSDAGAPDTYSANNYIHLRPGDGEDITGIATFGDLMIVAKETNLFVFYGVSTAGTGDPIFQYRRISIPARINNSDKVGPLFNSLVVGDDGIYFTTNRGVYVTTGGPPQLISGAVTPVFDGTAGDLSWSPTTAMNLSVVKERIYLSYYTTALNYRVLVYDMRRSFWTVWSLTQSPIQNFTGYATTSPGSEGVFFTNYASAHVYKLTAGQTTDAGTAIAANWTSGLYPLGEPGRDSYTRYTSLIGTGTPTVSVFTDHGTTDTNAAAVTLGASNPAQGLLQQAYKGQLFQHKISSTSGAWNVSRVQHEVAWTRP